jgi:hypothetical protein
MRKTQGFPGFLQLETGNGFLFTPRLVLPAPQEAEKRVKPVAQ